ncbi:MAG: glycerophosphodiester phosphodiesterase family protein [Dermatophilaceae bacterium]
MIYGEGTGPLAIAHRGGSALAPENSLVAFGLSSALGLRYLETDIRVTCDGQLVCFHDDTLERVTSDSGLVRSRSLEELRALRINGIEPIPTFDEALDAFPGQCFTVDLKDQAAIGPLLKSLGRQGVAERVCIAGAWDGWLGQVRREVPEVTTALGWRSLTALLSCARAGLRPPKALATAPFAHVPVKLGRFPVFVERLVAMSHDIGVRVVTWTVDDPVVIRRLLDVGVDAIITDRPDVLREVLVSRNQWAPMLTGGETHRPLDAASLPKHAEDGDRSGVATG